jgi:hypothetical protein
VTYSTANTSAFTGGIAGVRQLANGEILVLAGLTPPSTPGKLWLSSGWSDNTSTATFSVVLAAQGSTQAYFSAGWSVDTYGPVVVAAEYGPKASSTDMARYVHMSTDYGETWEIIFDLYTYGGIGVNVHLHGVAYDPWWDAIWVCAGDAPAGEPYTLVSFDRGESWREVYTGHQFTSVVATPTAILFCSDFGTAAADGHGNGIYRVRRVSKTDPQVEPAHLFDSSASITTVGTRAFRANHQDDAPALLAFNAGAVTGPGVIYATYDGVSFRKIFEDVDTYANRGVSSVVGTLPDGSVLAWLNPGGADLFQVTVAPTAST